MAIYIKSVRTLWNCKFIFVINVWLPLLCWIRQTDKKYNDLWAKKALIPLSHHWPKSPRFLALFEKPNPSQNAAFYNLSEHHCILCLNLFSQLEKFLFPWNKISVRMVLFSVTNQDKFTKMKHFHLQKNFDCILTAFWFLSAFWLNFACILL